MTAEMLDWLASIKDLAFWSMVKREGDCWIWTGYINRGGYGRVCRGVNGMDKSYTAHRYSWLLAHGSVPAGMDVCHKCDNRKCVRPDHLFLGTRLQNMADMRAKDRSSRGERNMHAKLTEQQVRDIRELASKGVKQRSIAKTYRMTQGTISHIISGRLWKHIP